MATDRDQEAVLDFFKWSIPTLLAGPNHIDSSHTRPPAKFDKHFHTKLMLRRVVYCPSLVDDFDAMSDNALSQYLSAKTSLPSTALVGGIDCFPSNVIRNNVVTKIYEKIQGIINEESVRNIYATTLIPYCLTVASTLEFQLPTWSSGYLTWELAAPSDESCGIADGFLQLKDLTVIPSLYKTTRKYFPNLAVWEFKNLKAGSREVFESIRELARMDLFPWITCEAGQLCGIKCKSPPDSREALINWQKFGPDAPNSVCQSTCKDSSDPLPPTTVNISARHALHGRHITQQVWAEMVKEDTTFACLSSGRLKMYFYRNRTKGLLYISDCDATDRAIELERERPETWDEENPFKAPSIEQRTPQELLSQAKAQQWLILSTQKKPNLKSILNRSGSFLTDTPYRRIISNAITNVIDSNPDLAKFLHVSISGDRHTSNGTFQVNGIAFSGIPGYYTKYVVVKTANAESALIHRKKEFQAILDLQAANVTCIPDVLGCFWHHPDDITKLEYAAFIFEDVGDMSLDELWSRNRSINKVYADAAKDGLRQIHAAGYRHRNISLCDIIIRKCIRSDRSLVSFVNFREAKKITLIDSKERGKMKKEEELLENLLLDPLKRSQSEDGEDVARGHNVKGARGTTARRGKVGRDSK